MNKSLITNLVSLMAIGLGALLQQPWLWTMGIFAFSGAITNWLAVHMLFEKVPGLYGSGVIPARFTELKQALYDLIMQQFFNQAQLQKFMQQQPLPQFDIGKLMAGVDLSPAFDALLDTVQKSSFGGMLAMFGGAQMLLPLKQPFIDNLTQSLSDIAQSDEVQSALRQQLGSTDSSHTIEQTIASMVQSRLDELTPELVKTLMQQLIAAHLGWLVVWGGVFGAVLGLINHVLTVYVLV